MKNYLYKEFVLSFNVLNWLFLIFPGMLLVPAYPGYVGFFYICLSVMFIFNNCEINKDMQYSMILPISKSEIVKSRCIVVAVYELIAIVLGVGFAVLNKIIDVDPANEAGIASNVAFFGYLFIILAVFNFVYFVSFYKKGEKPGKPFFFACIAFWLVYFLLELTVWAEIPGVSEMLDGIDPASLVKQIPILAVGIVVFIAGWILTYKISAKRFEKVNL
ncbi:MAG: ABC-2 transporter permease [Treponema sp.]|nr:ABC-2 transporter permease [Treponema sp.]